MAILDARPLVPADIDRIRLRPEAEAGLYALGLSTREAITLSARNSVSSYIVLLDGEVLGVWGYSVKSPMSSIGYPWMLATELADRKKIAFAKHSFEVVQTLKRQFSRLESFIFAEDLRAQHWMSWLGFVTQGPAIPIGKGMFVWMVLER